MPFELGIAFALAQTTGHRIFTFEEKEHRIDASLSDMRAFDPTIHGGTPEGALAGVLDRIDRRSCGPAGWSRARPDAPERIVGSTGLD